MAGGAIPHPSSVGSRYHGVIEIAVEDVPMLDVGYGRGPDVDSPFEEPGPDTGSMSLSPHIQINDEHQEHQEHAQGMVYSNSLADHTENSNPASSVALRASSVASDDSLFGAGDDDIELLPPTPVLTEAIPHRSAISPNLMEKQRPITPRLAFAWTSEPRISSIVKVLQKELSVIKKYTVAHLWNGTYNKFYSVNFDGKEYVMKITLPVCPVTKTESEIATLKWSHANTNLEVPHVVAYSSSPDNAIGCEWILMTRIQGRPLSTTPWKDVPYVTKLNITKRLAEYTAQVYKKQFEGIGNLYPPSPGAQVRIPQVGELVSRPFFWGVRPEIETNRGPFSTNREWVLRRLNLAHEDLWERQRQMRTGPEQKLIFRMLGMSGVCSRLWNLHDKLFLPESTRDQDVDGGADQNEDDSCTTQSYTTDGRPEEEVGREASVSRHSVKSTDPSRMSTSPPCDHTVDDVFNRRPNAEEEMAHDQHLYDVAGFDSTMLWHDDLSADNIFIDSNGILTGIVGWDSVSLTPVALACDWPAFITEGRHCAREPRREHYMVDDETKRVRSNYWRDRRDHEMTTLRYAFAEEMRYRAPGWYQTWSKGQMRRDYDAAVSNCDNEMAIGMVEDWCDVVEQALDEGLRGDELRSPRVMSLAGRLTEGVDWREWEDTEPTSPPQPTPFARSAACVKKRPSRAKKAVSMEEKSVEARPEKPQIGNDRSEDTLPERADSGGDEGDRHEGNEDKSEEDESEKVSEEE
ncbi:hypothetical protein BJ170DRAFT_732949 [Xylariales sp. AK1849]|nr:hypothetical protein BJ170DRAFT_732949 [Xylariales sp. AK1849]